MTFIHVELSISFPSRHVGFHMWFHHLQQVENLEVSAMSLFTPLYFFITDCQVTFLPWLLLDNVTLFLLSYKFEKYT